MQNVNHHVTVSSKMTHLKPHQKTKAKVLRIHHIKEIQLQVIDAPPQQLLSI
jgi:hypothetical protein